MDTYTKKPFSFTDAQSGLGGARIWIREDVLFSAPESLHQFLKSVSVCGGGDKSYSNYISFEVQIKIQDEVITILKERFNMELMPTLL